MSTASGTVTKTPEVGGTYAVDHSRKGKFVMRITAVNGEWIDGIITSGKAKASLIYNEREIGEKITVRECLATFTQIPA
jgi:hypothetical protein